MSKMINVFTKTVVLFFLVFVFSSNLTGQNITVGEEIIFQAAESDIPAYYKFRQNDQPMEDAFILWLTGKYDIQQGLSFSPYHVDFDNIGMDHLSYRQKYNDIVIEFAVIKSHSRDKKLISFSGNAFNKISISNNVVISEQQALDVVLNFVDAELYKWEMDGEDDHLKEFFNDPNASYYPKGELVLINPEHNFKSSQLRYAYRFDIYAELPLSRADYYIDAETGKILFVNNKIHFGDVPAVGVSKYSDTVYMTTDSVEPGVYRLRQAGRGKGIETYNMKKGTNYNNAVDFTDDDNFWDSFNTDKNEVAVDAHWATEKTYDYFFLVHGRNSIDNDGYMLRSYIHYDNNYVNAFWNGQWMTYGDGNATVNPLVCIDIVAHEITHGLTSNTANLIYAGESGALNEGFSDIFGNMVELYARPHKTAWTVGEDINFLIRNMKTPKARSNPDTYGGTHWIETRGCIPSTENNRCGVHKNSTVKSHWFYLLAEGGSGTNDNGHSYSVQGIGVDKAEKIAFRTLTVYLSPPNDFIDARFYTSIAAVDLYGQCSPEVEQVLKAWYAVGVGGDGQTAGFDADRKSSCQPPFNVQFRNISDAYASFHWDFGDGNSSQHITPNHTYKTYGTFDVTLIATSLCKTDTIVKKAFITVDEKIPCIFSMPRSGVTDTVFACKGKLFDDGGPDEDYSGNLNSVFVIAPPGASKITLVFHSFAFEGDCDCDWVYFYDGPGISSPLIGRYSGFDLPNGGVITSTGGAITVRQYTDPYQTYSGFELDWFCWEPGALPKAIMKADKTAGCSGDVQFSSFSINEPDSWYWDFGDGNTSTEEHPFHVYEYPGAYTVKLIARNPFGYDTLIREDFVSIDIPAPPAVESIESCGSDSFVLTASSYEGIVKWFENKSDSLPFHTGDSLVTTLLNESKTYYVVDDLSEMSYFVGPEDSAIGAGGYFTGTQSMIFDVYRNVVLKSVRVYARDTAERIIRLNSSAGTMIMEKKVNIPAGSSRIELDFSLPVDNGLRITASAGGNLFRNSSGPDYPYTLDGILSITGSTASQSSYYYYFYDWELQIPCKSIKKAVHIWIDPTLPVADFSFNVVTDKVSFTDNSLNGRDHIWAFGDGDTSLERNPVHQYAADGEYSASLSVRNSCGNASVSKAVLITGSLDETEKDYGWVLYPVPANQNIYVRLKGFEPQKLEFRLNSVLGQSLMVKEINVKDNNHVEKIQLGDLPKGIYFVRLTGSGINMVKQIIVE